jgi:MinD superfamily P-loop ATPase
MCLIEEKICIGCGACEAICPISAIVAVTSGKYSIGKNCVECSACITICPVDAISM